MPAALIPSEGRFALFALSGVDCEITFPSLLDLGDGFLAARELPIRIDNWREGIGTYTVRQLNDSPVYLMHVAEGKSERAIYRDLWFLYLGLLIAVQFARHKYQLLLFRGSGEKDAWWANTYTSFPRVYYTIGSPDAFVRESHLRTAKQLAMAMRTIDQNKLCERFHRIVRTFREASYSGEVAQRLHQFVRTAEGFLDTVGSGRFAYRAQMLTEGNFSSVFKEMYQARSSVEHLRGPYARLSGNDDKEKHRTLIERAIQAEAFARFCLVNFLSRQELWPHFKDDTTISNFWNLPHADRMKLWMNQIPLTESTKGIDERLKRNEREKGDSDE